MFGPILIGSWAHAEPVVSIIEKQTNTTIARIRFMERLLNEND
jgi:hypothetical protein